MKHLLWLLSVLLVTNTVSAQQSSVPSATAEAPLVIEVRAQRVSRDALSSALEKELAQGAAEKPKGALELSDTTSDTIRLSYRDATGRVTTRDLYLAPDDPEMLEKITIAAANLVRDQSGAISQLEAAERAEAEAALAAALAAAPAAPPPKPSEPPKPVYDPCHPPLRTPFGFDLAWMLGTSSTPTGRQAARNFSLGLFGTYSAGVHGAQLSVLGNIDRHGMCGVELAAAFNLNLGPAQGLQLAVVNFSLGALHGAQLGVANVAGGVNGAQLGVFNLSLDPTDVQIGVANIATGSTDVQIGVLNYELGRNKSQIGVTNLSWGDTVGQLGVLNIAAGDASTQIGVVNYARTARSPIGLLNIVPKGHTGVDAWVNENGAIYGALTHGGDRIYNMYGVGTRVQKGGTRLALAIGLSARMYDAPRFSLEMQVFYEMYPRLNPWRLHTSVERLRIAGDIKITDRISIVPAVGYALMLSDEPDDPLPFGAHTFRARHIEEDGTRHTGIYGFPSFAVGLRVQLSDPKRIRRR